MKPYLTVISPDTLIGQEHGTVDYQDAFGVQVPLSATVPPEELVLLFFESFPTWARFLMGLRETIASLIGLKTAKGLDVADQLTKFRGEVGQSIALFHVRDRSSTEILTGEKDKHLDFSLSFIGQTKANHFEVVLATTVIFKGWLGKLYFLPVKPIHRLLVPAMLRRMAKKLASQRK